MSLSRTEVDSSRCSAWTFTRLRQTGYPQYLRDVDEVICPRFLFVSNLNDNYKLKIINV